MEAPNHISPAERKRPAPPLPTTLGPSQESVLDNTHTPRSRVVLHALPDGIVVDSTMKNLVQWNEALRDGLRLKDQEAADVDKLPRTLATATSNASTPARRPDTNADKQALDTDQQQVQTVQQQQEQIKTMPDTYIQRVATADESPVMQLLREMQQQLQDIQQQQLDMQATLQHQTQQHQSFQEKMLKRQELEHLQAARVQDQERSRDLLAIGTAVEKAFGERASGLQERSQQITMREKELKRI